MWSLNVKKALFDYFVLFFVLLPALASSIEVTTGETVKKSSAEENWKKPKIMNMSFINLTEKNPWI